MTTTATPPDLPACLGVMCPEHGRCQRYYDVERYDLSQTMGNCFEYRSDRPRFIPIKPTEAE